MTPAEEKDVIMRIIALEKYARSIEARITAIEDGPIPWVSRVNEGVTDAEIVK